MSDESRSWGGSRESLAVLLENVSITSEHKQELGWVVCLNSIGNSLLGLGLDVCRVQ